MKEIFEKLWCYITGALQNFYEFFTYDNRHCHFCNKYMAYGKYMTDEELDNAMVWIVADTGEPVCEKCKQDVLNTWYKIWKRDHGNTAN